MLGGMELSTHARRRISTALALVLAVESISAVSAAAASSTTRPEPSNASAAITATHQLLVRARPLAAAIDRPDAAPVAVVEAAALAPVAEPVEPAPRPERKPLAEGMPAAVADPAQAPRPAPTPDPAPARHKRAATTTAEYRGTNHVWIPALGINRSVRWFPCDRSREPDNYMYRWGCAGANNVYLMGHAYSIMEPLHDAYVSGRLRVGMKAWYADGDGRVRVYAVRWWKLTRPTPDAAWAWAAQDTPSMTLQTCVGKNSEYRLMVRLTEVDG